MSNTPGTPASPTNRSGYADIASPVDYEKALMGDDEEAYLKEMIGGGAGRQDSADLLNASMADVSVTSNFTAKFFPPSPSNAADQAGIDNGTLAVPILPTGNSATAAQTPTRAPMQPASPQGTPMTQPPPTQYVVNDPSNDYDDDISTIANDTYVAKYMADSNPNQLPPTPTTPYQNKPGAVVVSPASPDMTDGASQPTHIYTYNKLPKKKMQFEQGGVESSTSEESGVNVAHGGGDDADNKTVFSVASFKRFRGGSGWSRKNYTLAIIMSLFLLAVIAGLGYTFLRLQVQQADEDALDQQSQQSREPDANGSLNNPLPDGSGDGNNVFGDGWTLRPSASPVITQTPTITRSNAPSPIGPSPRPTKAPTANPTRRPTTAPSMTPSSTPTTPFPTIAASSSPTQTPSEVLRQVLLEVTSGNTVQFASIPGTPQQRAFEWLHQDPNFLTYLKRRQIQRFALAVLYYSTTQPQDAQESLQTWMEYESNECTWFNSWFENRFPCGSDDIYKFLTLRNINLVGTIPSELALLTKLNSLVLSNNGLSGTIPKEIGEWDSLENLDLRGNFLNGRIPDFKNVPNLKNITLSWNGLTGNVPPSITNLNMLQTLDLTENSLFGFVPDQVCAKGLESLAVDCNEVVCKCCTECSSDETRAPV
ncbi:MAG: hypothetical protein SGBAC_012646, partial [Bacillariaceae sp.]